MRSTTTSLDAPRLLREHGEFVWTIGVERLRTPAECESFALNAIDRKHPELASAARRKL